MNKLGIIAISGIAVSIVSLGIAISIAAKSGKDFDFSSWGDDDEGGSGCRTSHATAGSRAIDWTGGDELSVTLPVNLHFKRGQGTQVVVNGDPELVSHVKIDDDSIKLDCNMHRWSHQRLDVTLPGNKTFREINVKGAANVDLQDLNQPELVLSMAGAGDVTATGKTDHLEISIAGHSAVRAKDLIAKKVEINIAGSGDVDTSPQDSADISIAGRGDVKLYSEPKHIETSILGAGNVEHLAPKN